MSQKFSSVSATAARACVLFGFACALFVHAQELLKPGDFIQSRSQQFMVNTSVTRPVTAVASSTNYITTQVVLTSGRLAIIAERIKENFLRQLRLSDQFSGTIYFHIEPFDLEPVKPRIQRIAYRDAWQFRVTLPEQIRADDLVRLITQLLIEEMATRFTQKPIEVPIWLVEGMTEIILRSGGPALVPPLHTRVLTAGVSPDAFVETREMLASQNPVSIGDLSLPEPEHLTGHAWQQYRASSHLLVHELLSRQTGHRQMREFVRQLPRFLNSQMAFMQAFDFPTLLDAEKWWKVTSISFRSRDRYQRWSQELAMERLEEALRVYLETAKPNSHDAKSFALQDSLAEVPIAELLPRLNQLIDQLRIVQFNAPPDLARLIRDYHVTLTDFIKQQPKTTGEPARGLPSPDKNGLLSSTRRQLDMLDAIRQDFRTVERAMGKNVKPAPIP